MDNKPTEERKKPILERSIIDCDIHNSVSSKLLKANLPRHYRERVEMFGLALPGRNYINGGVNGVMAETTAAGGGDRSWSAYDFLRHKHLDPFNVEYGILSGSMFSVQASPDFEYAGALCTAYNDATIEEWLTRDKRLKGSILIPKQAPELAAKEIDRIGGHPDIVQVFVGNGATSPYGNSMYNPIYEACVRHNLPFTIHVGNEGVGINPPPTGAGHVSHYVEHRACRAQVMMAHLASFIFEGVFERFPTLKVVLQEAGVFWIPAFLWRLDQDWKSLRVQTPWVKKKPSEYFRENVRVTTQPIEEVPNRIIFDQLMQDLHADETVMFCSDYPHWDYDSPARALPKLDHVLWDRIFYQNAAELFQLPQRKTELEAKQA